MKDQRIQAKQGEAEQEEDRPQISLDYYHSTRRRARRPGWPYVVSMVFMLASLILVLVYQRHCGKTVSKVIFDKYGSTSGNNINKSEPASRAP